MTLTLIVLAGLMTAGCSGKQTEAESAPAATAVAAAVDMVTVPGVVGLTLDRATDQLEDLGFDVESLDTVAGKSIIMETNWQVTSQDPADGASLATGSTVHLGVRSLEKLAAEKAAADKVAADKSAAELAAAEKAAAEKAAADQAAAAAQAAAEQAARDAAAQQAAKPAPAPAASAPAAVYYANCTAAKAAGAAPVYAGTPGYGTHLDRDRDGIGCDK